MMGVLEKLRRAATMAVRHPGEALGRIRRELKPVHRSRGFCPICDQDVIFKARHEWFRDHLLCSRCRSIPRERALMQVIQTCFPDWRHLDIHESSPEQRSTSVLLASECAGYIATQYDPSTPWGERDSTGRHRSEDLEHQTFADASFDLVITQDVFEHIFDIDSAFREIARSLRPGGAHIFTTPLVNGNDPTRQRATRNDDGTIEHLAEPEYHANPMDETGGSLVTWHYGRDIIDRIESVCGLSTQIISPDDISQGLRAEYLDVLITRSPLAGQSQRR